MVSLSESKTINQNCIQLYYCNSTEFQGVLFFMSRGFLGHVNVCKSINFRF